ncbi:hypothetical protein PILCRDRAFT_91666 [Piloderma croceum F 1598]|uniref:XPG-I domain-containing protein n=1 Tax=Piloderma croceum (strain F 1598) TaxID=765440 RepID=A0A0C3EUS1_PILCF|nr:hypothetical protein PILCRDRAFT_91666 [Piloderma croceum F 1598]
MEVVASPVVLAGLVGATLALSEVEAKPAAMNLTGHIDAIVTNNVDTFLFGGLTVIQTYVGQPLNAMMDHDGVILFGLFSGVDYNPQGLIGRQNLTCVNNVTDTFLNPEVVNSYITPLTSLSCTLALPCVNGQLSDLAWLGELCEWYFEWATPAEILLKFHKHIWPGVVMRMVREDILKADMAQKLVDHSLEVIGPSSPVMGTTMPSITRGMSKELMMGDDDLNLKDNKTHMHNHLPSVQAHAQDTFSTLTAPSISCRALSVITSTSTIDLTTLPVDTDHGLSCFDDGVIIDLTDDNKIICDLMGIYVTADSAGITTGMVWIEIILAFEHGHVSPGEQIFEDGPRVVKVLCPTSLRADIVEGPVENCGKILATSMVE